MSVGALCSGYMAGMDSEADLRTAMSFIGKYNATLNPSSGGFDANDIRAALMRGISIYPWTFRGDINTYKSHLLWGYSGLTGDNANVFRRIARNVAYTPDALILEPNSSVTLELDVTYYNHETKTEAPSSITILSGNEFVTLEGNTLTFTGMGAVTFYMSYEAKVNNEIIVLHTQPATLSTVSAPDPEETTAPEGDITDEPTAEETTAPTESTEGTESTESTTAAPNDTTAAPNGEDTTAEAKNGCKSTLGGMAILMVAGAVVVAMKKKEE
jgi:hypothetical protein